MTEALDRLVEMAHERRPHEPRFAELLPRYYGELAEFDVDNRSLDDMYAVAAAHFAMGRVRRPGDILVRVLAPDPERDGWQSSRSVVLVVTDDAPFMVDTIRMALDRHGVGVHFLVHPMLAIERDEAGAIVGFDTASTRVEAWTLIEIDRIEGTAATDIEAEVRGVVGDVHRAVGDFAAMRAHMASLADIDPLLGWLADDHFVFLGSAVYDRADDGELVVREDTRLGQLRVEDDIDPPGIDSERGAVTPMHIARSEKTSTIHRHARRTCVSVIGEGGSRHRFLGLLAASTYRQSVVSIPTIGDRARAVLGLVAEGPENHTSRSMRAVLETLPRDLVFELDTEQLARLVIDIVGLQERNLVRIFDLPEPVGNWSTILVYLPRARFDAQLPETVAGVVANAYGSPYCDLESLVSTSSLARITLTVRRGGDVPRPDLGQLEHDIDVITTSWDDVLRQALIDEHGDERGRTLFEQIGAAAPVEYRTSVLATDAVLDIERIDHLLHSRRSVTTALRHDVDAPAEEWRFRVFRRGEPFALADILPLLDHLGLRALDEWPYEFDLGETTVHLYDIGVTMPAGVTLDAARHTELQRTFESLVTGEVEPDGMNRLVVFAGLRSEQVAVLRAYARYLRQIGFAFSRGYIESTLARLPEGARSLVELFEARFDPLLVDRDAAVDEARARVSACLDEIQSLDDDRICRAFRALIDATTRTSAYRDGPSIAFKFDPAMIPELPKPRPAYEIFVCSPRVEGVHLRGGAVARGGLRWSDRPEDFRTEVLGLVKAQMVKNSVIVPAGAKGGFVVKQPPGDPAALRDEVAHCYREFVSGLLDLTDNVVDGAVVHPDHVVRYDGDDTYMVVAADKGTASFSDLANEIAAEYGYWLGDAFASGGSAGYDHKEMGITARGAWESVRRHAAELGKDPDRDPITAVGIGDMSGDVFGNGMLLSRSLRLIAAFDHRHVFIDPDPDVAVSYAERRRLFELPRSSWADYDQALISPGGGVYSRSIKRIALSPEARKALGIDAETLSPIQVVQAILTAPVDLLWNGGIGTYVKASTETHAEVGDRANDAVRVDAADLRCAIVGEGGNLGLTQRGRVEFALAGGLINTDAIDNSAGVDSSDHEVNIKIVLDDIVKSGELTLKQRNELLVSMTDEVAELVLDNNRAQTLALAIARRQALPMANVHGRYLDQLESEGYLDRALEFLPTDKQVSERQSSGSGLTAPEFAVLIAYTKNADVSEIITSDLPDDPALVDTLLDYFPTPIRERYPDAVLAHRLRREIVATGIVNQMVNMSGISYDHRMTEDTGASTTDVVRAWVAARDTFGFVDLWEQIEALEGKIGLDHRLDLALDCRRTAERLSLWLLRHRRPPLDIRAAVDEFRGPIGWLADHLHEAVAGPMRESIETTIGGRLDAGIPADLARRSGVWKILHTGFDLAEIAVRHDVALAGVARSYWKMFDRLELMWLWDAIGALPRADRWQTQARSALRDDLFSVLAELAATVMVSANGSVDAWVNANERAVARVTTMFTEIRRAGGHELTALSVALRQLRNLSLSSVHER